MSGGTQKTSGSNNNRDSDNNEGFIKEFMKIEESLAKRIRKICEKYEGKKEWMVHFKNCLETEDNKYEKYVAKYQDTDLKDMSVLFLGMNPSWKVKNAIPFDYRCGAEEWLLKSEADSKKADLSKEPFWHLMKTTCGTAENFFKKCLVRNYCPFAFGSTDKDKDVSLNNHSKKIHKEALRETKDACDEALKDVSLSKLAKKIPKEALREIKQACDEALKEVLQLFKKHRNTSLHVIVLGEFATKKIAKVAFGYKKDATVLQILHPSCRMKDEEWQLVTIARFLGKKIVLDVFDKTALVMLAKDLIKKLFAASVIKELVKDPAIMEELRKSFASGMKFSPGSNDHKTGREGDKDSA